MTTKTVRYPQDYVAGVLAHPAALTQAGIVARIESDGWLYADVPGDFAVVSPMELATRPYTGSWIITVPAFFRRFDVLCAPVNTKQLALVADPDATCQALVKLAHSRIREGIDLQSQATARFMGALVQLAKVTAAEATAIRTTTPTADEVFR